MIQSCVPGIDNLIDALRGIEVAMVDIAQKMQRVIEQNEERAAAPKVGRPKKEKTAENLAQAIEESVAAAPEPFPVAVPKCADCGAVLTVENTSKSAKDGRIIHAGCPKAPPIPPVVQVPVIEKTTPSGAQLRVMEEVPAPKKAVTYEEVYAAATAHIKAHEKSVTAGIIAQFVPAGSPTQLSKVPPEKYEALMAALEGDVLS